MHRWLWQNFFRSLRSVFIIGFVGPSMMKFFSVFKYFKHILVVQRVSLDHFHLYIQYALVRLTVTFISPLFPLFYLKWHQQVSCSLIIQVFNAPQSYSPSFSLSINLPSSTSSHQQENLFYILTLRLLLHIHCSKGTCHGISPESILYLIRLSPVLL
jgi:hypothetical protein